jgi:hypothetical protein
MEDRTGTAMCVACTEDAMKAGVFTMDPKIEIIWEDE